MGQVKMYGHAAFVEVYRKPISDAVHAAVVEALDFPADKRFHRFFPLIHACGHSKSNPSIITSI